MANGFSGKSGTALHGAAGGPAAVKTLEVTKWTFDPTVSVAKYNSNATFGHKRAVAGVHDSKGTIEIKVDGVGGTQLGPGDEVSLQLLVSEGNGFQIAHAVIQGAPLEVDIDNGEVVSSTYAFESSDYTGIGLMAQYGEHGVE
jgi:hypothetical protein